MEPALWKTKHAKRKKKKETKSHQRAICDSVKGGIKNTALVSLRVCALQQRCFWNFRGKLVSEYFHELLCEKILASLNSSPRHPISLLKWSLGFILNLPSGMRDWNSSHRRPLCYLYLFTEDYNAQGDLNKDGMKAIWSKKVKWQCQNLRSHRVRDARDHSTWSPTRRLKSLALKSKHWLLSSFEGKLAKFYIKLKSFELQEKTHRNFVDRAHEYTHM